MELIVVKLLPVVALVPLSVVLTCESILAELGKFHSSRMVEQLLPFVTHPGRQLTASNGVGMVHVGAIERVRLVALRSLVAAQKGLSGAELLEHGLLQDLLRCVLPQLQSTVVDVRQATILVLAELYGIVGDALYPYLGSLTPPQLKLLTIYIDKRRQQAIH
jgi:hypothetical protein